MEFCYLGCLDIREVSFECIHVCKRHVYGHSHVLLKNHAFIKASSTLTYRVHIRLLLLLLCVSSNSISHLKISKPFLTLIICFVVFLLVFYILFIILPLV